jgi:hypothetical protein
MIVQSINIQSINNQSINNQSINNQSMINQRSINDQLINNLSFPVPVLRSTPAASPAADAAGCETVILILWSGTETLSWIGKLSLSDRAV